MRNPNESSRGAAQHQRGLWGKLFRVRNVRRVGGWVLLVVACLFASTQARLGTRAATSGSGVSAPSTPSNTSAALVETPTVLRARSSANGVTAKAVRVKAVRAKVPAAAPAPPSPTGPPNAPVLSAPTNGASGASTSPTLDVSVTDPASSNLTVTFYGKIANATGQNFTLAVLPDTQFYSAEDDNGTAAMYMAQTQWIANNQAALNIPYVVHLGDIVNDGASQTFEWTVADSAMTVLENANIPYGVHPGNHDEGVKGSGAGGVDGGGDAGNTTAYNQYFGVSRFSGRSYYGGHYSTGNDDHYDLISAGGMNFIIIYFAYDENITGSRFTSVLSWAQGVLQQYSDRHAILVSHYILQDGNPAQFGDQGQVLVTTLGKYPNVFLTLSGHYPLPGEGQRVDTFNGNTVTSVMSDFQDRANGGDGWMRIMTFSPSTNQINVQTYSPVLNQYMTDSGSQFSLPWNMQNSGYTNLGSISNVASGSHATMTWNNLATGVQFQWYAVVTNGTYTTTGPTWSFTTGSSGTPGASLSATNLAFGSQIVNTKSASQSVSLTNTGTASLNISSITPSKDYSQSNTCGTSVTANNSCTITVTFQPTVTGTDNGTIIISDNASGGSQTITLTGSGAASAPVASLSTTSLNFGSQTVNTSSGSQPVTLTNTGNASLTGISVAASGDYSATTCPSSLSPTAACKINVTFMPTATGTRSGAVTINDNAAGSPQTVTLTGTGTGSAATTLSLSPTSLSFGSQSVGTTSSTKRVTLYNTGSATLSIASIVATGDFSQTNNCGGSVSMGSSCRIRVSFKPTATGTRTGSIAITDNASGSPQTVSLTGTGR